MNKTFGRRHVLQTGMALGASLLLPSARACEFFTSNLRIFHPFTQATGDEDFAVVCMKFDEVRSTDRLIGVETPVAAKAELGGPGRSPGAAMDLLIPAGEETLLSDKGTFVRLTGLNHPLYVARAYPLKLVFEKGGEVNALLSVDFARFG